MFTYCGAVRNNINFAKAVLPSPTSACDVLVFTHCTDAVRSYINFAKAVLPIPTSVVSVFTHCGAVRNNIDFAKASGETLLVFFS